MNVHMGNLGIRCFFTVAVVMAAICPLAVHAVIIGGNDLIERAFPDGADGLLLTDLNAPISVTGSIDSWSIWANQSGGQIQLLIYRDLGSEWEFIGSSELETVATLGLNTFTLTNQISVELGDLISWWYPNNTVPSVAFDSPGAVFGTINNHDWPSEPITTLSPYLGTIPDLSALGGTQFQNTIWDNNPRTYSIAVHGIPEPETVGLLSAGLGLIFVLGRVRKP